MLSINLQSMLFLLLLLSTTPLLTMAQYGYYYGPQRYWYPQATMFYRNTMPSPFRSYGYSSNNYQPYYNGYSTGYQQPYNNYYQSTGYGNNNYYSNGYNSNNYYSNGYNSNNNYYSNGYNGYSSYYPQSYSSYSYPTSSSFMGIDSMTYPNRGGNGMANLWLICSTCTRG